MVVGGGEDRIAASLPNVVIGKDKAVMPNNTGGRGYNARYPRGPLALRSSQQMITSCICGASWESDTLYQVQQECGMEEYRHRHGPRRAGRAGFRADMAAYHPAPQRQDSTRGRQGAWPAEVVVLSSCPVLACVVDCIGSRGCLRS